MVLLRLEIDMPTTLTLKNVPDLVYDRLKLSAERLARARELRAALPKGKFEVRDIDELKRAGRP